MFYLQIKPDLSAIDSTAVIISVVGILIVFSALTLIYLFFKRLLPAVLWALNRFSTPKAIRNNLPVRKNELPGDVAAAAAITIYLHFSELHDNESNVITIKRVSRTYSPWSSKIYSMRNRI